MKHFLYLIFILFISLSVNGQQQDSAQIFGQPLMERYVLDELKSLRKDQQRMAGEIHKQLAEAQLKSADRAIEYTTNTTNNIFYIITAAASLLVILGWKSLNDIKRNLTVSTEKKLHKLTNAYEERLNVIEEKMKERSKVIIDNQEKITSTNNIHSLWMRSGLEKSEEDKIAVYDEILQINPQDIEAMTYKADALLEIDEVRWALNLTNHAIDLDKSYSQAYWQRACAYARLNRKGEAIKDIKKAIEISESLADELEKETHFENIKSSAEFQKLLTKYSQDKETK
jgi:tetratricopeptide (TPR) repeat protein